MRKFRNILTYIFYFFRHDPLLGVLLLFDEVRGEWKYGISTSGYEDISSKKVRSTAVFFSYSYMPSNYVLLERLFRVISQYGHNSTILDLGCGKGRALAVSTHFGFRRLLGVELVQEYCLAARALLTTEQQKNPNLFFEISCGDAGDYQIPDEVQILLFYNPFKERVMQKVVDNVKASLTRAQRDIFILYLNPLYQHLFTAAGFTEIYSTSRFRELKATILQIQKRGL